LLKSMGNIEHYMGWVRGIEGHKLRVSQLYHH
jgi:hypothetical protein